MAVDPDGNPAYISSNDKIFWKLKGKWSQLDGCSTGITIGPDGTLYSRDCNYYVNKFLGVDAPNNYWERIGDKKCSRLAIGEDSRLWIRDYTDDQILVFDAEKNDF